MFDRVREVLGTDVEGPAEMTSARYVARCRRDARSLEMGAERRIHGVVVLRSMPTEASVQIRRDFEDWLAIMETNPAVLRAHAAARGVRITDSMGS